MLKLPRWLWLNHVPAGLDLTPEQKQALRARMRQMGPIEQRRHAAGRRMFAHMAGAIGVLIILFILWIVWLLSARLPPTRFAVANVAGVLVFNALTWVAVAYGINRGLRPLVWRALNDIGFRVCMSCGYVLDYLPLTTSRCPECGTAVRPPTEIGELP